MKSFIVGLLLVASTVAFAGKSYQVTGTVVEMTATTITIDKKGEKFEIAWPAGTKANGGEVKKGSKVTVWYSMSATEAEVKAEKKK